MADIPVGSLVARIRLDQGAFERQLRSVSRSVQRTARELQSFGRSLSLAVTVPLTAAGAAAVRFAASAEEMQSKLDAVFRGSAADVRSWAATFADETSRGRTELQRFAADAGAQLRGIGFAGDQLVAVSQQVVQLSQDIGSFFDADAQRSFQAVTGALVANREALKNLGIVLTEVEVQQRALANTSKRTASELTLQEKAAASLQLITEKLTAAGGLGDAARTANSFTNVLRGLRGALEDVGVAFGQELTPRLAPFVRGLREALQAFRDADPLIRQQVVTYAAIAAAIPPVIFATSAFAGAVARLLPVLAGPAGLAASVALLVANALPLEDLFRQIRRAFDEFVAGDPQRALEAVGDAAAYAAEQADLLRQALFALAGLRIGALLGPAGAIVGALTGIAIAQGTFADQIEEGTRRAEEALAGLLGATGQAARAAQKEAEAALRTLDALIAGQTAALEAARKAQIDPALIADQERTLAALESRAALLRRALEDVEPAAAAAGQAVAEAGAQATNAAGGFTKLGTAARDAVQSLRSQAVVLRGELEARRQGTAALQAYNRELFVSAQAADAARAAIGDGLSGQALADVVLQARAAAGEVFDLRSEVESLEKAQATVADQSAGLADALALPFRNAFQAIQNDFASTLADMLDRGLDSWRDFWGRVKSLAINALANVATGALFRPIAGGFANALVPAGAGAAVIPGAAGGVAPVPGAAGGSGLGGLIQSIGSGIGSAITGALGGGLSGLAFNSGAAGFVGNALTSLGLGSVAAGTIGPAGSGLVAGLSNFFGGAFSPLTAIGGLAGSLIGNLAGFNSVGSKIGGVGGFLADAGIVATAAGLGTFFGPIGTGIGALIGGLISAFGGGKDPTNRIRFAANAPTEQALIDLFGREPQSGISAESLFGFIGIDPRTTGKRVGGAQALQDFANELANVENELARLLSPEERERVQQAGIQTFGKTPKSVSERDFTQLIGQRIEDIVFRATGLTDAQFEVTTTELIKKGPAAVIEAATNFLQTRNQVRELIEEIRGIGGPETTQAARALEEVADLVEQLSLISPRLGLEIPDVAELQGAAEQRIREGFVEGLERSILELTDPAALLRETFADTIEAMRREVEDMGAGFGQTERLIELTGEALVRDFNAPLDALLDSLDLGRGILAPTETLRVAREVFEGLAEERAGGAFVDPAAFAAAARDLLDASRAVNASSQAFFEDLAFVRQSLGAARLELPGFASGGSFTIPRGVGDTAVPLFRASAGETVTIHRGSETDAESEMLAELRLMTLQGAESNRRLEALETAVTRQQSELMRLARKTS